MQIIDNINKTVKEDLQESIRRGSKMSVAAACFSMYAYQELKKQLEQVDEFSFIFTSPTFVKERAEKEKREFYIPRLNRESSLYGTEFEIKLRNEMTQRAIARECADWIRRKATFKSNTTGENMGGFMTVASKEEQVAYMPINGFTTVDLGCERGNNSYNMVNRIEAPFATQYIQLFDTLWNDKAKMQDVTDVVVENISSVYNENSPEFIYFITLYHVFSEFLDDISEDVLPNEATGFKQSKIWSMLYDFQRDAVLAIINKLEKYNGCILADSVGLGKTFTALAVIKYYENRNKSVLVLCPKKLAANWNTYRDNYVNNPIAVDRLNYDVLFHTDLSRNGGTSNGLDLDRLNWGNYDLIVIDESHNFRNGEGGAGTHKSDGENRYQVLMRKVIRAGVKTKPIGFLKEIVSMASKGNCIVMDFFSGSGGFAQAVMQLNAEDGGHRKFIMVQLPEPCDETSEAYKAGYKNICEIGKERIRRAGDKIKSESPMTTQDLDIGFRVLKLDDTNMKDVYYAADDYSQDMIAGLESNIKDDRTDLDLLFGCLIDWGLPLSLPYRSEQMDGCTVHTYNGGDLIACFDANIPESVVKTIAKRKPLRAVFRDSGFASSPEKINVFEIFKLYMPEDAGDITKRVRVI